MSINRVFAIALLVMASAAMATSILSAAAAYRDHADIRV